VKSLVMLISKEFFLLVGIGTILAFPAAWYFTGHWLQHFAYRIELQHEWPTFLVSALVAFFLTLVTVGYHVVRAASSNPVKALRDDWPINWKLKTWKLNITWILNIERSYFVKLENESIFYCGGAKVRRRFWNRQLSILDWVIQGRSCKLVSAKENKFSCKVSFLLLWNFVPLCLCGYAFNFNS